MLVILLDKILKLGNLGEKVNVKPGYARNFLIPRGKAIYANKQNIKIFEKKRTELELQLNERLKYAQNIVNEIKNIGSITIKAKSGSEGRIFGSVGRRDIVNVLYSSYGIKVDKSQIRINGDIRHLGEHYVDFQLNNNVSTKLKVIVDKK